MAIVRCISGFALSVLPVLGFLRMLLLLGFPTVLLFGILSAALPGSHGIGFLFLFLSFCCMVAFVWFPANGGRGGVTVLRV